MKTQIKKIAFTLLIFFTFSCSKDVNEPDQEPALANTNIYTCGYEFNGTKYVAKFWKNGIATNLSDDTNNAIAYSIAEIGKATNITVPRMMLNSRKMVFQQML